MGGLVALVPALLLARVGWIAQLVAAVVVTLISIWASEQFTDEGDPAWVVVDGGSRDLCGHDRRVDLAGHGRLRGLQGGGHHEAVPAGEAGGGTAGRVGYHSR